MKRPRFRRWRVCGVLMSPLISLLVLASAGALSWGQAVKSADIKLRASCVDSECHSEIGEKKFVHGPVSQHKCEACHVAQRGKHVFELIKPKAKLCQYCHEKKEKNYVHEPVSRGDCQSCHDPHEADFKFMLLADPATELCFTCHEKKIFLTKKYVHGPLNTGACILCHEAHSSWEPKLLIKKREKLCFFCHDDMSEKLSKARHIHEPVLKDCTLCHDAHQSDYVAQLKKPRVSLCFECHEDIQKIAKEARNVHGAISEKRECNNCHEPHYSRYSKLITQPLLTKCLSCHNKTVINKRGEKLLNMADVLHGNPEQHGPIRQGNCIACHAPHGSDNFRLLVYQFPKNFYVYEPFDLTQYALCFQCHNKRLVTVKEASALTNFRTDKLNLHFVHVNREVKGRTCRACHRVHASKLTAHIRASVPFGGWDLPVGFEKMEDGGRCSPGCHETRRYKREYIKIEHREEIAESQKTSSNP